MTLFFTEMWERFSYYGMRALLILYLTADTASGGLGFTVQTSALIYGIYTFGVYATGIPGGWIADRILGQFRAVLYGGVLITAGHFAMALPGIPAFFAGLGLIIVGTGLLKTNVSTMVGSLYEDGDPRRDGGFSIFYMGINLGAFLAPLVVGTVGQTYGWHYGFGLAGIGMALGLVQYMAGKAKLQAAIERIEARQQAAPAGDASFKPIALGVGGGVLGYLASTVSGADIAMQIMVSMVGLFIGGLAGYLSDQTFTGDEWKRIRAILVLFVFSTLFWAAFEQAGSSLNLFADRVTSLSLMGFAFPSTWFQSLNALFIMMFAPVFAGLWVWLAGRKSEPSSPAKFVFGLVFVGLGFLLLVPPSLASAYDGSAATNDVSPMWLVGVYLLHTVGELCLSPVGLSTVTKLAPQSIVGSMMGVWFLSVAIGNFLGGWIAGFFESLQLSQLFGAVAGTTIVAGVILVFLVPSIRRMMVGVH
ncbi:MAG: MFS transporter [Acidobacteria bacterium]|nr:MFS transporter [Acidobacteriota bacterium]